MRPSPFGAVVAPPAPTGLVARTVALDSGSDVDLLAVAGDDGVLFERDGVGLAGRGCAFRVALPGGLAAPGAPDAVARALSAMESDDRVNRTGSGPVAFGALPFDPRAPAFLVVPRTIVGRAADGSAWLTTVGPAGSRPPSPSLAPLARLDRGPSPSAFRLVSHRSHEEWCALVEQAVAHIRSGALDKVVLAREVLVEANLPLAPASVLARLRALYPSCVTFSLDGFVGASPELLVARTQDRVSSHPLAGTVPRSGDPGRDGRLEAELLASPKDRHEHQVVVDAVVGALGPVCASLAVPPAPSIVSLRNVSHLGTLVQGRLAAELGSSGRRPGALELAARLHPTPAVAGCPRPAALAYLRRAEGFDRGRFAGPVGWVDARGDGRWVVGIRSAELDGHRARLVAGVGVVADSVPEAELTETQLKLQALLAAVVRP